MYRAARQPAVLWRHALHTLVATLALLVGAFICWRVSGWLQTHLERRYRQRVRDVSIQSFRVVKADQFWRLLSGDPALYLGRDGRRDALRVSALHAGLFPWTRATAGSLIALVIGPLRSMALGLFGKIPNVVFLAILFLITRYVLKLIRLFFESVAAGTVRLRELRKTSGPMPTYKLVRVARRRVRGRRRLPVRARVRHRGLQGRVAVHRRGVLARVLVAHRQRDRRLQHDVSARLPYWRSREGSGNTSARSARCDCS